MDRPLCGEPNPAGLLCRFEAGHETTSLPPVGHSWEVVPPQLPADKTVQALYVKAAQDLQWLADNGALEAAAQALARLRYNTDYDNRAHAAHLARVQAATTGNPVKIERTDLK